jgi:4a-hydroxytetrahydrobiopterin dehydratase
MNRPSRLADDMVAARLANLPGWTHHDSKLLREFRFTDFSAAFAFMTRSAMRAEQLDHHPDWFNVYNRVKVQLSTHDADGVTELDFLLAEAMNSFAGGATAQ